MQVSEVPLYPAAGKLEHLFNFPRLHQVFLDFGLKKKKKKKELVLFQSNQTKKTVRICAGLEP